MLDITITGLCLHGITYYCLWFTDENNKDQLLTKDKKVVWFLESSEINRYISENGLALDTDQVLYDVDVAIKWLNEGDSNVDCKYILNIWNITGDLAYSIGTEFLGDSRTEMINGIYHKVFEGNNLPALRVDDEPLYFPEWDSEELHEIRAVITDAVRIIESAFPS